MIVIDFGTATTFNIINENNEFIGRGHCPRNQRFSRFPGQRYGETAARGDRSSEEHYRQKYDYEHAGGDCVRFCGIGRIYRYPNQKGAKSAVYEDDRDGGFSQVISKEVSCIDVVDKLLTLEGLKYLYYLNRPEEGGQAPVKA